MLDVRNTSPPAPYLVRVPAAPRQSPHHALGCHQKFAHARVRTDVLRVMPTTLLLRQSDFCRHSHRLVLTTAIPSSVTDSKQINSRHYTSTGFQAGGERNSYVARAQLREKSLIDGGHITALSHTFPRRFEDIVPTTSQAYRDLRARGPFHIVNIDACGSIAAPRANHTTRLIDAVYRVVELQLEIMTGRWLLFVSADARPNSIAEETLTGFCDAIFANAASNEDFHILATPLLDPNEADIRAAAMAAAAAPGTAFLQLFSLGLAKWLLHLAHPKQWDIRTHHPYCYSTMPGEDETPSMACLAFEFIPPPPGIQDRFRVARANPAPNPEYEDTSIRAVNKIRDIANADSRIRADEPLRTRMTQSLRTWLEEAGYDRNVLQALGA